jgi:predicted acylesterase/phospholipase RssA
MALSAGPGGRPPFHLSLVLSGGLSLGAYQAGAVAQIGHFVACWNRQASARGRRMIHIDVVSGASAGALTGAILARFVATGSKDPASFVRANHEAWCGEGLSFARLLDPALCSDASYLSNQVVDSAAACFMPSSGEVRLEFGQSRLIFTCTLTSLGAIPFATTLPAAAFGASAAGDCEIVGTTRREWVTFRFVHASALESRDVAEDTSRGSATKNASARFGEYLMVELGSDPSQGGEASLWTRFRWYAVASGAFPYAWCPVRIPRSLRFYPRAFGGGPGAPVTDRDLMDGGILDNMPLGRAARVLQDFAKHVPTPDQSLFYDRAYVLIEPSEPVQAHTPPPSRSGTPVRLRRLRPSDVSGDLFAAIREQSFYTDLRTASDVNRRLRSRMQTGWPLLAKSVRSLAPEEAAARLAEVLDAVAPLLTDHRTPEEGMRLYTAREDVAAVGREHGLEAEQWTLFAALALYQDLVSDLEGKHELDVLRIAASQPLAGAFMGSFGGFVHPSFMHRDFCVALEDARRSLEQLVAGAEVEPEELQQMFFDASGLEAPPPGPDPVQAFEQLPADTRDAFVGLARRRAWPYLFLALARQDVADTVLDGTWRPTIADVEHFGPVRGALVAAGALTGVLFVAGGLLNAFRPGPATSAIHHVGPFLLGLGCLTLAAWMSAAWWVWKHLLRPWRKSGAD